MGAIANVLAAGVQIPAAAPRVGQDRVTGQALRAKAAVIDADLAGDFASVNEVQTIAEAESDDGTWTLTINLYDGTTYTTAALAHDANAAAILAALDTASPASVPNGHVAVTGGPIDSANVVLTFSGASVAGKNHPLAVATNVDLELSSTPLEGDPEVTQTTQGQPARSAMKALYDMGVVVGAVPAQGETPVWTKNRNMKAPRSCVIHDLAKEAAREEANDAIYTVVKNLYGLPNSI